VRRAACAAALVETAVERRGNDGGDNNNGDRDSGDDEKMPTPNEMFVATLAALTAVQTALENKQQQQQQNDDPATMMQEQSSPSMNDTASELENTVIPLLEILRRILPYVANYGNNRGALLAHQLGTVSRSLRLFVAMAYALPAGTPDGKHGRKKRLNNNDGNNHTGAASGANALLRQILKTTTTLLLVPPSSVSEKDVAKLLHGTIIPMFHDARPKVRKAAWGCATEIVIAASASHSASPSIASSMEHDPVPEHVVAAHSQHKKRVADFLWEYCQAVLTSKRKSGGGGAMGKESSTKLMHVLRFLAASLPFADDERIRVKFGEVCLVLVGGAGMGDNDDDDRDNSGEAGGNRQGEAVSMGMVREVMLTLLSCLEQTEKEQESMENENNIVVDGSVERELPKFAARALAFLLQHRLNMEDSSYASMGDVTVAYGRCLLSCMERMLGLGSSPAAEMLAMKLLPNVLTSMLRLCDAPAGGGSGSGGANGGATSSSADVAEACGTEFNRFVSRVLPVVMSHIVVDGESTDDDDGAKNLQRVVLETIPSCLPVMKQALQIQYRNAWGSILSGGYASFVTNLALKKLEIAESSADGSDSNLSELESNLQSWLTTLVASLLRLHDDVEKDGIARSAVEYATSALIRGMGLELFLSMVNFVDEDGEKQRKKAGLTSTTTGGGIRDDRAWLLPLLKQSAGTASSTSSGLGLMPATSTMEKTHISFFQGQVLNLARKCDAASADGHRTVAEASIQKSRVVELWSMFPSFCVHPVDMKENFAALAKTLVKALGDYSRYPKLIPIICGGLKTLAIGIMERAESNASPHAKEDYDVLSSLSTKLLPSLFKLVETLNQSGSTSGGNDAMETEETSKEKQANNQQNMQLVEAVTDAIGQLAQISPPEFLQNLFKKVVQRLLVATTEISENTDDKEAKNAATLRICSLLGLGQALIASGSLDDASLSLLYRAVRPLVRTDEFDSRIQKRSYKVFAEICDRHKDFVTSPERLDEMIDLLVDSIVTCQVSARHMRLKCVTFIVEGFDSSNESHMAVIPKVMGEVLLCLKDSNAKTRESAYQLLLALATARDDMTEFFKIILAALGAQTSHMRSAAVMAISRLTFEYARNDYIVQSLLPSLMQTVAVLFDESSREVTKSVIGFVRVCVAAMTAEQLEPLLLEVVGGLMKYNKGRDRFRAKIKIILKKLVRVYGYDKIAPLVPEKDTRLITHMRKLSERATRRKAAGLQDGRDDTNNFDDMMESDEDDSDDGRTFMTGVTGFTKMTSMTGKYTKHYAMDRTVKSRGALSAAKSARTNKSVAEGGPRIRMEENGEILDMLDSSKMARSVRFADMNVNNNDFSDDDDDGDDTMQFDNQGRIIISDVLPSIGGKKATENDYDSDDYEENLDIKSGGGGKRRRVSKFESMKLAKAEKDGAKVKKRAEKKQHVSSLGSAYKSKKAGGDVKKKGQKFEPYAYMPLNAKDYTKKNRDKAVSKMGTVVRNNKRKRG